MKPLPTIPACLLAAGLVLLGSARAADRSAAAADVMLLDFSAAWCGPCRQMAPLIDEIAAAGWKVRHVDVDHEHDLVRRFGVTGVPCYVLVVGGHEAGRIDGATTRTELEQLLARATPGAARPAPAEAPLRAPGAPLPAVVAAEHLATEPPPARPVRPPAPLAAAPPPAATRPRDAAGPAAVPLPASTPSPASHPGVPEAAVPVGDLEHRLLAATARLRVDDGAGVSWGTGTVIDCRQGEALILTCGHIFRDSQGKGRIAVDVFGPHGPRGVAGQVVSWDLKRDLALVSIFTDAPLAAARVGDVDRRTVAGDAVVTVGCNGGADPTIHRSRVTAVDKYLGPANVQVAGQPVQGRSGGGLFAADGTLIGVCNAADPADNEGLFAALPAIHEQLEEAGLAFVYRNVYPSAGLAADGGAGGSAHVPSMPAEMPPVSFDRRDRTGAVPTTSSGEGAAARSAAPAPGGTPAPAAEPASLSPGEQALLQHVRQHGGRAEVICIVRPHGSADETSEVFVLKGASGGFVEQLARAHQGEDGAAAAVPPARGGHVAVLPSATKTR